MVTTTFAYFRLGLQIEGIGRSGVPVPPEQLAAMLAAERPPPKELAFLRRLCLARDAGALLVVVCAYRHRVDTPTTLFVPRGALLPPIFEAELVEDTAHNERAAANTAALASEWAAFVVDDDHKRRLL